MAKLKLTCVCGKLAQRSDRFDAYLCAECDVWLEGQCDDVACLLCHARPLKPSDCDELRID